MEVIYSPQAVEDLKYWKKSGNKSVQNKINKLIASIIEHPFEGLGKPESLKYELSGLWSRRISQEHRIVYEVYEDNRIVILEILSLKVLLDSKALHLPEVLKGRPYVKANSLLIPKLSS